MHDGAQANPMAEIALALAMGFFSIMVLTVISMGAAPLTGKAVASAILVPASAGQNATELISDDTVIVYHDGRFLDTQLRTVDPVTVKPRGRLILAIDPGLPLGEAMNARARFAGRDLVVSTLNGDWLRALKEESR